MEEGGVSLTAEAREPQEGRVRKREVRKEEGAKIWVGLALLPTRRGGSSAQASVATAPSCRWKGVCRSWKDSCRSFRQHGPCVGNALSRTGACSSCSRGWSWLRPGWPPRKACCWTPAMG